MDPIEKARRERVAELNSKPGDRAALEAAYGKVWDPREVAAEFEILQYAAPYVVCRRRADAQLGSLEFQHHPRFYFNFMPDQDK